ncbi:hypothetical protein MO867_10395 [Microbulbifer sp. OS29]|uniref:Uncharacterized protein n=1 Tax=Microbulbifer okhotskensis TaxID=2926617 RepID=A0A9X2ES49_9GAMM|nr:hypothetical protein [Microbulbifer okhotskensis]MCO1334748.1 hypothetical protein [Microbulbifer okhotskensis]
MSLYLRSAAFTPIETINISTGGGVPDAFGKIAIIIKSQTDRVISSVPEIDATKIDRHFLCSTMIELPFSSLAIRERDLNFTKPPAKLPVTSFINTYECASWGYSLRHYLKQRPDSTYIMVSILDANLMDLSFWRSNENWGTSGFGLCTLLIEVRNLSLVTLTASCAITYNTTAEFATVIRKMVTGRDDLTLSLPFFPENIRQIFTRLLNGIEKLPDLHDRWGHCFGSDPWLNIICQGVEGRFTQEENLLACSIALNGYYCTTEVLVDTKSNFLLSEAV